MPILTIIFGAVLIALGISGYLPHRAGTALIPAYAGGVFVLLGLLSLAVPTARKHFMHAAAVVALLGVLAPLGRVAMSFRTASALGVGINLGMAATCAILLALYVRSFIAARKAREATRGFDVTPVV